jgi:hypothetical protein
MGDRSPITDRGVEGRVTGYGDRVVAQGDTALRPPAGTAPPPGGPKPAGSKTQQVVLIATITIFDPKQHLKGDVAKAVTARVAKDMNEVRPSGKPADHLLKQHNIRFEVRHLGRMSTADERKKIGRLDFPLYIFNAHTSDNHLVSEVLALMREYGIRERGKGETQYREAESGWADKNVEGLGIQPLLGFRKVGFVKGDNVAKHAKDLEAGFVNVIKHELGHMCGIEKHGDGVMRTGNVILSGSQTFTDGNAKTIIGTVVRLATLTEATLQTLYETQTP